MGVGPQLPGQRGGLGPVAEVDHQMVTVLAQPVGCGVGKEDRFRPDGHEPLEEFFLAYHPQRAARVFRPQPGQQRKGQHQVAHALHLQHQNGSVVRP